MHVPTRNTHRHSIWCKRSGAACWCGHPAAWLIVCVEHGPITQLEGTAAVVLPPPQPALSVGRAGGVGGPPHAGGCIVKEPAAKQVPGCGWQVVRGWDAQVAIWFGDEILKDGRLLSGARHASSICSHARPLPHHSNAPRSARPEAVQPGQVAASTAAVNSSRRAMLITGSEDRLLQWSGRGAGRGQSERHSTQGCGTGSTQGSTPHTVPVHIQLINMTHCPLHQLTCPSEASAAKHTRSPHLSRRWNPEDRRQRPDFEARTRSRRADQYCVGVAAVLLGV